MPVFHRNEDRSAIATVAVYEKPLMRGWSHATAAFAAVAVTVLLLFQTWHNFSLWLALLIFGVTKISLYAVSAIFHIGNWRGRLYELLHTFDFANIFLFIAGAYTPFCVAILGGWQRVAMLALIWSLALIGVASSIFTIYMPRWFVILLYIGMGWLSLIMLPQVFQALSLLPVLLLVGAGLLYTIGAVFYAMRWPDPFPRIFGFHEIFHLLVIAGTITITTVIWLWVVPLQG